jgi:hypothetical protein
MTRCLRALFAPLMLLACVPDGGDHSMEERAAELRPTDPAHPRGYASDVEIRSHESPQGYARVWWATHGVDRPLLADTSSTGVPDFVELVANVADEVNAFLEEEAWRLPVEDSSVLSDPDDYGGDGRFDIYLKDFGGAGDGQFSVDACVPAGSVQRCAGHMVLENDFSPLYYPSREYAVRVVVPHEYFHAVQAAYATNMPVWWSEGSATWFQEHFYPEQNDFENLTRFYFATPERSLDDRSRGPSDAFGYGAAIFVYFLEQLVGADAIVEIMERMATGRTALDAIVDVVESRFGSFDEAFAWFGIFNVFTGSRAVEGQGYPLAGRFAQVPVTAIEGHRALNWDVQVASMAARFGRIDLTGPVELSIRAIEGFEPVTAVAVSARQFAENGHYEVLSSDAGTRFDVEDGPIYLVLTRTKSTDDGAVRVTLRPPSKDPTGPDDDGRGDDEQVEDDDRADAGCAVGGGAGPGGLVSLVGAWMSILVMRRIRRRA